ncbi:hypothetical protein [Enterobacter chuandaensis]|uniref:hypothetical protein n=1 Tax=Enterobacter chuandaensis TaxID=2497875 RepID=UPI001C2E8F69|nr:hypothetical protein [Enterobacter chuandaensis]
MSSVYTLNELLGLLVFSGKYQFLHNDLDCMIIAWAEDQITEGNDSETLLILASLGLDNQPERAEVELYMSRYLAEQQIDLPSLKTAALVWIKLFMSQLSLCASIHDVEQKMCFVVCHWFEPEVKISTAVVDTLKSLYWHLFDEWEGPGTSEAVRMEESEFFELINRAMLPYSRKIENPDWLDLLVR